MENQVLRTRKQFEKEERPCCENKRKKLILEITQTNKEFWRKEGKPSLAKKTRKKNSFDSKNQIRSLFRIFSRVHSWEIGR